MAEKNAEVPADRCGFELPIGNKIYSPVDSTLDSTWEWETMWRVDTSAVCCWRPIWDSHDETDRCIWHADVDEKPLAELITARAATPEQLDGAILRDLHGEEKELSLSGCSLLGARFDTSKFLETDFTDADLRFADFTDVALGRADFTDARLDEVNFTDARLDEVDFTDADLRFADFIDASCSNPDFTDARIKFADFTNVDLRGTADFTDAELRKADFTDASLGRADFTDADLRDADLSGANARRASFRHTRLQNAVFTRADCRGATFTSALLYETVFSDTRINATTTFVDPSTTFYNSITARPGCVYEENPLTANQLPENVQPLEAARWVYRQLEILNEENALSEAAREFHISKEEAERARYWDRGEYGPWGVKTLMWYFTKHGESVKRVLTWWGGVMLTAGFLLAGLGGVRNAAGTEYAITALSELRTIAGWQEILWNVYFSITTFSTIMDGGLAPVGPWTRVVVAVESLTGALLVALLVFVLGRRVAR
jgi:uncharacterized protein YjbI with pentapeptide repeats